MTGPELADRICAARVDAARAGRDCARCWAYWPESEDAAWAAWLRDGLLAPEMLRVLGEDVAQALWQQGYRAAVSYWRAPVYECACCHKRIDRLEWLAREERQGRARVPYSDGGGVVSTVKCTCENGLSRILDAQEASYAA
jgi:hypothetical protein